MNPEQDAFGQGVYDFYQGKPVTEIIERDGVDYTAVLEK